MTTVLNDDLIALCNFGAHVFVFGGNNRQGAVSIQFGKKCRRFLNANTLFCYKGTHLLEELVLKRHGAILGTENGGFHLLELGGDVTLAIGKRLLANIILGHLVHKGFGNLNVVTKHSVVADTKRTNARFLSFFLGNLFKPRVTVIHNFAQGIEFFTVSLGNHLTLTNRKGRVFNNSGRNTRTNIVKRIEFCINARESLALGSPQKSLDFGENRSRVANGTQVFCICVTVNDTGNEAFQIEHVGKFFAKLFAQHKALAKLLNSTLTALNSGNAEQGLFHPFFEHTCACRRFSFIEYPQKRTLFLLVSHRFGEFEIATGVDVHFKILTACINVQLANVGDVSLFGFFDVMQKRTNGRNHCAVFEVFFFDLLAKLGKHALTRGCVFKTRILVIGKCHALALGKEFAYLTHIGAANVDNCLARRIATDFGFQFCVGIFTRKACSMYLTRRGIGKAKSIRKLAHTDSTKVVVALFGKKARLKQCAGSNHTNDFTAHKSLCLRGVLDLLANGNLVILFNQSSNVSFIGMERNTAHGCAFFLATISARKREFQFARCQNGVVKEHLVEVSETVKDDIILVLIFDFPILLHHGSHGSISLSVKMKILKISGILRRCCSCGCNRRVLHR